MDVMDKMETVYNGAKEEERKDSLSWPTKGGNDKITKTAVGMSQPAGQLRICLLIG